MHIFTSTALFTLCVTTVFFAFHLLFKTKLRSEATRHFFVSLYVANLLLITLLPTGVALRTPINWIPFIHAFLNTASGWVFEYSYFLRYLQLMLLNIVLFLPMGAIIFHATHAKHKQLMVIAISLFISLGIETLQYFICPTRLSDIDDVICNTLGGFLGGCFLNAFLKRKNDQKTNINLEGV